MNRKTPDSDYSTSAQDEDFITAALNKYTIQLPADHKINETISTLAQYVPANESSRNLTKVLDIFKVVASDTVFISKGYWVSCALLFVIAYFLNASTGTDPMVMSMLLAPVPFVLGLLRVQQNRQAGTAELELSCKIPAHALVLAKISVIGAFSIVMNSALSIAFYQADPGMDIWQLTFFWLTPFTLVSTLALWVSMLSRNQLNVVYLAAIWLMAGVFAQSEPWFIKYLISLNTATYAAAVIIGMLALAYQLSRLAANYHSTIERFDLNEINY